MTATATPRTQLEQLPGMVQLLREDGTTTGEPPPLSDEQLLEALPWMRACRVLDQRCISLQRQGKAASYAPCAGQDAAIVGSALAMDHDRDWMVWQYREVIATAMHGQPLSTFILYLRGHPAGMAIKQGVKLFPIQIAIGSQIPHAVGLAWGLKLQKQDGAVLAYFGDGATSEGAFHEGCNFAGVMQAPVVFFCQNNGWAISTPRSRQTAAETIAQKGPGYGIPGIQVDGNDIFAVYKVTREALERARNGGGPTLIEAVTYRYGSHTTADDASRYRSEEELEAAKRRDPIERVIRYLQARGLWDKAREAAIEEAAARIVGEAIDEAEAIGFAAPETIFQHVFAEAPPRLAEQRDSFGKEA